MFVCQKESRSDDLFWEGWSAGAIQKDPLLTAAVLKDGDGAIAAGLTDVFAEWDGVPHGDLFVFSEDVTLANAGGRGLLGG